MQAHDQTGGRQEATRTSYGLVIWGLAWMATLALATGGPIFLWDSHPVASWIAIGVNLAVGIGLMFAHARYLREIDELQRKIELDAMAVALGVGFMGGLAYVAADLADLIASDAVIVFLPALMAVVYVIAIVVSNLRYR